MVNNVTDVIIVGGGLSGLTLACALAGDGLSVAVVESSDPHNIQNAKSDGRCSAIAYGSQLLFQRIGVWDSMKAHAGPILDIRVSDSDSRFFLHYDHALLGDAPMGYMVENHVMLKALYARAAQLPNLQIHAPARYQFIEHDEFGVQVTLDNDVTLQANLLCAADGKYSKVRKAAGINVIEHDYDQVGIVCTIEHEQNHNGIAQERFLPTGPFAVLPMHGGYQSSLVWTEKTALAPLYLAMNDNDFNEQITRRIGDCLGKVRCVSERFSYPLTLIHAKTYVGTRLALVGDAAHGIHPLAGQGFNLGIRDVEQLSPLLARTQALGLDIGTDQVLENYNALRKFDSLTLAIITTGLNGVFLNNLPPVKLARRLGMATVNHLPVLKKFFMRHAMGMVGS